ncbi:MAG: XrtA/PEP-CTERM system histidine kinase PrsK [Allosphingosinicella sp.]|uniref:XrtA/PEP-CTERM system histidine kinase PrsK n=1 Tax=Allosphingosinicella sp. TaxID=2823234 RepID=UPI00392F6C9F
MISLFALWSHLLAAALFGALAIWQLRHWHLEPRNRPLVSAFAAVSVWSIFLSMLGPNHFLTGLAESARNLCFLAFMYGIHRGEEEDARVRGVKAVYAAVAGVIGLQIVLAGTTGEFSSNPPVLAALTATLQVIGITIAAGSLVLVHNLYGQAAPGSRWGIQLPMIALAAMWIYDLHLYTVAYLTREPATDLFAMRGAVLAMLVPIFALASKRNRHWKMQISRAATFQSLSVLVIFAYLLLMMSANRAMEAVGGDWVRGAQIGLVFAMTLAALILLPSGRARAWARVMLAKHFFEHRYDYRAEWLRFTHTVGRQADDKAPIEQRIVKALADIGGSPAGILLLADERYRLEPAARWNWHLPAGPAHDDDGAFARFLEESSHVVDFGTLADGALDIEGRRIAVPGWMQALDDVWAGIPLIHNHRLVGLVVLEHPLVKRPLDWEDFDLFRTAGIQAASYLAEARSHQALADAQRFDEFNRRFAFIMHDIKNLVSQLSLVARNAERHADNPEFRADMIATLQSSVRKMNDLLARLSPARSAEAAPPRPVPLHGLLAPLVGAKKRVHPVEMIGDAGLAAMADPAGLEQALGHLVQNAIDASRAGEPVRVSFAARGQEVAIEVADSGAGMSGEFIRTRLFQPFASTKQGGFGVGAFEARTLIAAMGGRIEVESREGEGSRFTVFLPRAGTMPAPHYERMRA